MNTAQRYYGLSPDSQAASLVFHALRIAHCQSVGRAEDYLITQINKEKLTFQVALAIQQAFLEGVKDTCTMYY